MNVIDGLLHPDKSWPTRPGRTNSAHVIASPGII